jgi:hypothetical protein
MTRDDFIKRVEIAVYESSIKGTLSLLIKPPGRRPSSSLAGISKWYNVLSTEDKERIHSIVQLAARTAVFAMLTVLDGVTSVRGAGEEIGSFELRYTQGTESVLLNDPRSELLHDLFASRVPPA